MNRWQLFRQVSYMLRNLEWSAGNPVFSQVVVSAGLPPTDEALAQLRIPLALIVPGASTARERTPDIMTHRFDVVVMARNEVLQLGESALLGGARDLSSSEGRGVLELEEKVHAALGDANQTSGISFRCVSVSAAGATIDDETGYTAVVKATYECAGTAEKRFQPPPPIKVESIALGIWAKIHWFAGADRYDAHEFILRRGTNDGDPAPTSVTEGTGITIATDPLADGSVIDNIGPGTWNYSMFLGYDTYRSLDDAATSSSTDYSPPVSVQAVV